MLLLIFLISLLIILCYCTFTKNYNYWPSKKIAFEKPFLIFGNIYDSLTRKTTVANLLVNIYNKHKSEPYVGIYIFNQPTLLLRSPELIRDVMVKGFDNFLNRKFAANEKIDPIAYNTLFIAQDQAWKSLRNKITPFFSSGRMKLMFPLMKECAKDLNCYLTKHSGETFEFRNLTKRYAVDIISSCAFGVNSNCVKDKDSEILKAVIKLNDSDSFIRSFSIFSVMFAPLLVNIFKLTFLDQAASKFMVNIFQEVLQEREKQKIVRHDLIDMLNELKNNKNQDDDYVFDDIKMAAQALVFFSAGNDTTSLTLTFGFYELALNQSIQSRLREEIREVVRNFNDLTYELIQNMKYLDMVLHEILRKYPVATFLSRNTKHTYTFEQTHFTLERDIPVIISVAGLQWDPKHFPNPTIFDPQRFSDENKPNIKPFTYLPFGEGPRSCIGQRFAFLAMKIVIAFCLKDFVLETVASTPIPMEMKKGSIFLANKEGVYLRVTKL